MLPNRICEYILVSVTSSGILFAKQKLVVTFNFDKRVVIDFWHHACSNISTTPLRQWGFRQCLPFSWTILGGKHCRHPIAVMEVVDTFKLWMTRNTELKITMKKSTEVTKNNQASEWFPKKIVKSALSILWNLQTTLLVFWYTLVAMPAPKKSLPIRPAENSAVPHAYFLCLLSWSILINIDRIWWYQTIDWALSILRLPRK